VLRICVSFDECSSNSSDDVAVDQSTLDEAQVDAILEAADSDSPRSGAGRSRTLRHANSSALSGGFRGNGHEDAGHILSGGWKKYYIEPAEVARHQQMSAAAFERGSSQRVTLPLAAGVRESAAAGILAKRSDQPGLYRAQACRRSSRDGPGGGELVSTFGAKWDASEVNAECRTPTVGYALPVSLAARSQAASLLASGRPSAVSSSGGKPSGLLTPSSRRAAAHSADAQRGERLSNYRRGTMPRPSSAGHASVGSETESGNDGKTDRSASPAYVFSAGVSDDALDRSSSSPDDDNAKLGSQSSLTDWSLSSGAIVQDGGQGPAQPSFYPSTSRAAAAAGAGFHDYVNVSYLLSSRAAGRPDSGGMLTGGAGTGRSPWVHADLGLRFAGGRMAMSETESVENLAAAWPSYGTGPLHRSDSFKSAASGDGSGSGGRPSATMSSSLPRYGSAAQMLREDGAGPCLATFRLAAGQTPRSSAVTATPSPSSFFAQKSRSSASKDDNCMSFILNINYAAKH